MLAAPVPRSLMVAGNFVVALVVSTLQLGALMIAAIARGADFNATGTGVLWFIAAAYLFAIASYGIAEVLANRIPKQEEYVGATPAVAILPWFLAGSLFPIHALPGGLAAFAKVLPLTHALAVMRYGLQLLGGENRFDMTRAREELGFDPLVDLAEGVRRAVAWYRGAGERAQPAAVAA